MEQRILSTKEILEKWYHKVDRIRINAMEDGDHVTKLRAIIIENKLVKRLNELVNF
jgi:hypothetical protein